MVEAASGTVEATRAGSAEAVARETVGDTGVAAVRGVSRIGGKPRCF